MRLKDKEGTPSFKWSKKAATVNVANLDSNIVSYLDTLPPDIQKKILATSGNDSGHANTSRHYSNKAIDLRFDDEIWKYIEKDPNRLKYGLTLLEPDHGSAKHIHLSFGEGSENKSDVWMDPHSDKAKSVLNTANNPTTEISTGTPSIIGIKMDDNSANQAATIKAIMDQIQKDSETNALQQEVMAQENAKQRALIERHNERNNILDAIGKNDLKFEGRKVSPNQYFDEGGIVDSLDDTIQYKIKALKGEAPEAQSPDYLQLQQENSLVKDRIAGNTKLLDSINRLGTPQVSINTLNSNNQSIENTPIDQPNEKISEIGGVKGLLYKGLSELGLNSQQISGIVGSLGGESHENLSPTAENSQSKAFGIAQWYKSRLDNLIKFSKEKGLDYKSAEAQTQFLVHELKGTHKHVLQSMLNTKTLPEATEVWTRKFEIPGEKAVRESLGRRVKYAQNFLNSIK